MDKETKIFVLCMVLLLCTALPLIVIGMQRLNDKTEWCQEHGGVIVKTPDKWTCIDAKVLR